ncbi:MAG: DNA-directed RNA polymerase subunit omega [Bacteroidota bacterium]
MKKNTSALQDNEWHYSPSENVYENTVLIGKRARQLVLQRRADFVADLEDFKDDFMDAIQDNAYMENLAKKYERMNKPVVAASKQVQEGAIVYKYPE